MRYFGIIIFFLSTIIYSQNSTMDIQSIINNVKLKYAPDKRVAVFNVEGSLDGKTIQLTGETNLIDAKNNLLDNFGKDYKIIDKIILLPAKELGSKTFGVINLSVANVRTKPDHPEEMATQGLLGFPVKVLKQKGGWYLIQTNDEYLGWIEDDGIELMSKEQLNNWNNSPKVIYINNYGSSFSSPDSNSAPVSDLVRGDILSLVEKKNDYSKVKYPDGRLAYIHNSFIEDFDNWVSTRELTSSNVIKSAKSFLGIPYLWGGTSMKGVDCSGFTKSVYFFNGIILPRDASQQVFVGDEIDTESGFDKLVPGDLLFFGTRAKENKKERVTHVGMYLGDNEFIHSSGRVRINSLDKSKSNFSAHRFNSFLRAKRIINALSTSQLKSVKDLFIKY